MGHKLTERNPKVRVTAAIWSFATGMLAICIPLVGITDSGILLPLLVLLSSGGSTAAIWLASEKRRPEDIHLAQSVKALEERVMTLEAICTGLSPVDDPLILSKAKKD